MPELWTFGVHARMKMLTILAVVVALAVGSAAPVIASDALEMFSPHFGCYDPGGKTARTTAKIKGTKNYSEYEEQEVYQDIRYDTDGYRLKVPNGTYHVELKFCEIQYAASGQRVFGIKVQGQQVVQRLDIFATVGKDTAYEVRSPDVRVTDGVLRIEFARLAGSPCVAAMSVGGDVAGAQNAAQRVFYQHINCGGGSFSGYYADFGCGAEPNKTVQRTGASRSAPETIRTSSAAGSRR